MKKKEVLEVVQTVAKSSQKALQSPDMAENYHAGQWKMRRLLQI